MRFSGWSAVLALALVGCGGSSLGDERFATGSSSVATSADARRVYAVNVDEGTISRFDTSTEQVVELAVGREPTRIARMGDRLLVTLRGERGIAVVDDSGTPVLERVVRTGTEPFGVVASEDGRRAFVALSTQDEIVEFDRDLQVVRTFAVPGQPRWLALHPSGQSLYTGSAYGGLLHHIDLDTGVVTVLDSPYTEGATGSPLSPRITGDLSISPDGRQLAVPSLYVDNTTDPGEVPTTSAAPAYYASIGFGVSRMNAVIALVPLDASGDPAGVVEPMFFAGVVDAPMNQTTGIATETVRSYPSSVTYAPDGHTLWATLEASDAVAVMANTPIHLDNVGNFSDTAAVAVGFSVAHPAFAKTGSGPRGLAFTNGNEPYVHTFLDRSVASLNVNRLERMALEVYEGRSLEFIDTSVTGGAARESVAVSRSSLPAEIETGRKLFYSAMNDNMAGDGSGVSCSTCHFDGRNDGLSWHLHTGDAGFRNTPSLVGGTSATAPVTWTENVDSVADEADLTSISRMGGAGESAANLAAIQAFVEQQRLPDLPDVEASTVERGRAVFVAAGCTACHAGAAFVDHQPHRVLDIAVDTPTLRGIGATGPYFHDGSAGSLEAVLVVSDNGLMGDTSGLTLAERADLLGFLRSL